MSCPEKFENGLVAGPMDGSALIEPLRPGLHECLEPMMRDHGGLGEVRLLCEPKPLLDDVLKLCISSADGTRRVVFRCSSAAAPHTVRRESENKRKAKDLLGAELGAVILDPLLEGELDGRSFSVLPLCRNLRDGRVAWRLQRYFLRKRMLDWLRLVTARTTAQPSPADIMRDFALPLYALSQHELLSLSIRNDAQAALELLSSAKWTPRYVIAHNDLCKGNILLRQNGQREPGSFGDIVLIDWGGANLRGHAIYDLICLGYSLGLPARNLVAELEAHAKLLGCDWAGIKAYLLSSLGYLGTHLEQFPVAHYYAKVELCYQLLSRPRV